MARPILSLTGFGAAFHDRVVLADVTLDLPPIGLTSLVGPAGAGKSTLIRTLAGLNDPHPALTTWGSAVFEGQPLKFGRSPVAGEVRSGIGFVTQHARFFLDSVRENLVSALPNRSALDPKSQTELVSAVLRANGLGALTMRLGEDVASLSTRLQRELAIARALVADPPLLIADEPTFGLDSSSAVDLLAVLRVQARFRSILLVTHNQSFARIVQGTTALLAGGRIQEIAPAEQFFRRPATEVGQAFVRTGGCSLPSPDAPPDTLDSETPPPPKLPELAATRSRSIGPRGFFWVRPDKLGGLPRPGIVRPVEEDLEGLKRLGVTTLVTTEETMTVSPELLAGFEIDSIHFPVVDMGAPDVASATDLCRRVEHLIDQGKVVAVHCRAGLGRTGTLLACQLIFEGESARWAIERIRRLNPRCIQSRAQVDFLSSFEGHLAGAA